MTPVYTGYIYKNIISQTHTRIKCRVSYHICIIKYDNVLRHAASFCCFFWFWCCSFWFCFCFFWFCCCFFSFYFCFCSLLCLFCCWVKMTFTPPYVHFFSVDRVCHHHTYILLRSMYIQYSLLLLEKTIPASEYWYRCTVVLFFLFFIHHPFVLRFLVFHPSFICSCWLLQSTTTQSTTHHLCCRKDHIKSYPGLCIGAKVRLNLHWFRRSQSIELLRAGINEENIFSWLKTY